MTDLFKPKPKAEPAVQYVVALYDFEAQADGDLDFRAGDRIEVVERTESTEDWWTGKLNGRQGVFPGKSAFAFTFASSVIVGLGMLIRFWGAGNYVQDA